MIKSGNRKACLEGFHNMNTCKLVRIPITELALWVHDELGKVGLVPLKDRQRWLRVHVHLVVHFL